MNLSIKTKTGRTAGLWRLGKGCLAKCKAPCTKSGSTRKRGSTIACPKPKRQDSLMMLLVLKRQSQRARAKATNKRRPASFVAFLFIYVLDMIMRAHPHTKHVCNVCMHRWFSKITWSRPAFVTQGFCATAVATMAM